MIPLNKENIINFLFSDWTTVFRILLVGSLIYLSLVFILRIFGKRALAKMNAYDFVVTIALGSVLSTTIVNKDITLIDGALAMILLLVLQFVLAKLAWHSTFIDGLIKDEPVILFYQGEFDYTAMKDQRVIEQEIYQAIRTNGFSSTNAVLAVVLETTGDISVLPNSEDYPMNSTLKNLSLGSFYEHQVEEKENKS